MHRFNLRCPHQLLVFHIDFSLCLVSALDKLTHKCRAGRHLRFRLHQLVSAPCPLGGRTMLVQTPCSRAPSAAARFPWHCAAEPSPAGAAHGAEGLGPPQAPRIKEQVLGAQQLTFLMLRDGWK